VSEPAKILRALYRGANLISTYYFTVTVLVGHIPSSFSAFNSTEIKVTRIPTYYTNKLVANNDFRVP
jgi:hypothetical protein